MLALRAAALLLLLAPLAGAQPTKTAAPPRPAKRKAAPPAKQEAALRRRTGQLIMRLLVHRTRPRQEHARLRIEVLRSGAPVDRSRRIDVSLARASGRLDLRVRFREPPALRGVAILLRERKGEPTRAWRYDPLKRRKARFTPPPRIQRLAGTGLLWGDLRGAEPPASASYRSSRRLEVPWKKKATPREVLVVDTRSAGVRRRVHVERERYVPRLITTLDARGKPTKRRWASRFRRVGGRLRPFSLTIVEPGSGQVSRVGVEFRRAKVPPAHLDPDRFWQE